MPQDLTVTDIADMVQLGQQLRLAKARTPDTATDADQDVERIQEAAMTLSHVWEHLEGPHTAAQTKQSFLDRLKGKPMRPAIKWLGFELQTASGFWHDPSGPWSRTPRCGIFFYLGLSPDGRLWARSEMHDGHSLFLNRLSGLYNTPWSIDGREHGYLWRPAPIKLWHYLNSPQQAVYRQDFAEGEKRSQLIPFIYGYGPSTDRQRNALAAAPAFSSEDKYIAEFTPEGWDVPRLAIIMRDAIKFAKHNLTQKLRAQEAQSLSLRASSPSQR